MQYINIDGIEHEVKVSHTAPFCDNYGHTLMWSPDYASGDPTKGYYYCNAGLCDYELHVVEGAFQPELPF